MRILIGTILAAALTVFGGDKAATPGTKAEVPGTIMCEGRYNGHLQGVATDGSSLYWSFTVSLVKTDMEGKILATCKVPTHHGDLCCVEGKVWVAVNRGKFNQEDAAVSEVRAYDAGTLEPVGIWSLPDMPHGAGGMTYRKGKFYVVGGLPATRECNYVYEYTSDFKLLKRHELATGFTLMGIQTAEYDAAADRFLFGIYGCKGNPAGVLVVDAELKKASRHLGHGNVGLLHIGGRLYVGGFNRGAPGNGGKIYPAPSGMLDDSTLYVPVKKGGCVRFFFEGNGGTDWTDAGFKFVADGYKVLPRHNAAFVPAKESPTVWPAVGIGGKRRVFLPDLARGVRRAAQYNETLSFHLPGKPEDLGKDAAASAAVEAIRREASKMGVKVLGL